MPSRTNIKVDLLLESWTKYDGKLAVESKGKKDFPGKILQFLD